MLYTNEIKILNESLLIANEEYNSFIAEKGKIK